jgi:NADPH-dependent 2,4-dienoyl-CoA reductase/sulfur reductase-like enzyme
MIEKAYDMVIVGGGPAGMAAAQVSAGKGASVLLIDSANDLGGHFYKAPPENFSAPLSVLDDGHQREFHSRLESLLKSNVDVLSDTGVWGIFAGTETTVGDAEKPEATPDNTVFTLCLDSNQPAPNNIETGIVILAPGVYDRPIPFPGWTLPGVLTPGAVQMLLKKQGISPGKRVLVAGTGPLQLAVAANLASEGIEVVALLDTCSAAEGMLRFPAAMWGQWGRVKEAIVYMHSLLKNRVALRFRHAVYGAIGTPTSGVQAAVVGRLDPAGYPIPGTKETLEVDTICVSYGFAPSIELSLHLGCTQDYNPELGVYFPRHDERMQTTQKGVFVAGDVSGIGGKIMADLQGQVAGISALEMLGITSQAEAKSLRAGLQPKIRREQRFAQLMWKRFRIKPGYFKLASDEVVVCRCENVTAGQIRRSFAGGARDLRGAKLRTRVGMGMCQGRYCSSNVAAILAQAAGCSPEEMGTMSIRPPVIPVRTKNIVPS